VLHGEVCQGRCCLARAIRGMVNEYGSNGGVMISRGNPKNCEKYLLQCHFIHHESHLRSPGIEAESLQ
jgi:ABC-type transport system involved in cytochrome c biogenesis ATPase subunit